MVLHTVNKSPYVANTLASCIRLASSGDTILLIEDGVYAALARGKYVALVQSSAANILVLSPDASARGLEDQLIESMGTVDYDGFVELTTRHDKVISWF